MEYDWEVGPVIGAKTSQFLFYASCLFFRHLLVNPRDRRVVIIESVLCPSHFRDTLTRVLFKHFEVSV